MKAIRISMLAALLSGAGCCLEIVSGVAGQSQNDGGGSTTGGSTGGYGGSSSGGGSTTGRGNVDCSAVYCSPAYVCDPADGICKCGGQVCASGNCDISSGTCLAGYPSGCPADGGRDAIAFATATPGEASELPPAGLNKTYTAQLAVVACQAPPVFAFTALSTLPPGLDLYSSGEIQGVPTMASSGPPFEFEVEVQAVGGDEAFQIFLLQVTDTNPP